MASAASSGDARKPPPRLSNRDPSPAGPAASTASPHLARVTISFSGGASSRRDLRRRLSAELDQIRSVAKRFDSFAAAAAADSQLSATDPITPAPPPAELKRAPKVNKHFKNSDFVLGKVKDSLIGDVGGKKALKGKKEKGERPPGHDSQKFYGQAFRTCGAVLARLMKHKHGWVFNAPVDVERLGLHDYHMIIKTPMDLGTVKMKLENGEYITPREFAHDVRLTFRNAMTYNPKGQDVHFMAEQLLKMFEERWPSIEAEIASVPSTAPAQLPAQIPTQAHQPAAVPSPAAPPPQKKLPPVEARPLERSDSVTPKAAPAGKKPKAKDPNKREMTHVEKQRLSNNLQSLPPEKLESVVQIIKRRNLSLNQHDDEIEVDIDSFDVETLWELDRFVVNYKKSLSKNKRKAELFATDHLDSELAHIPAEQDTSPKSMQACMQKRSVPEENADKYVASSSPVQDDNKEENGSRSSSSGDSSSDSESSSNDSDSDSSSPRGSDAARSP